MIDKSKLELSKFNFDPKILGLINKSPFKTFNEVENFTFKDITKEFKCTFSDGLKLINDFDDIKAAIKRNDLNSLQSKYNGKVPDGEFKDDFSTKKGTISIDWDSIEDIFTDIDWNDDLKELDSDINQKNSDKNSVSKDVVEKVDLKSKENIEEKANKSDDNNESDMNLKGNYDTKICDLGLSVRTAHCLLRAGYKTLGDIIGIDFTAFYSIRCMGEKSIKELFDLINKFNSDEKSDSIDDKNIDTELANEDELDISGKIVLSKKTPINKLLLSVRSKNALLRAGYLYLSDIIDLKLADFLEIENMGRKSANEIYDFIHNKVAIITHVNLIEKMDELKINEYEFKDLSIGEFFCVPYKILEKYDLFNEDYNVSFSDCFNSVYNLATTESIDVDDLLEIYEFYKSYLDDITYEMPLDNKALEIFKRRIKGETLEEVGASFGLTRERIRQIEAKAFIKLAQSFDFYNCNKIFMDNIYDEDYNSTKLDDNSYLALLQIADKKMNFHLINIESKRLHLKNSYYEKYDERFKKIFNEIADQGYLLNTEYEFDTSNNLIIKYFLAKYNITKNDRCIYIGNTNSSKIVSYIKRNGYMDLSNENSENLKRELLEYLDYTDFDKHNITSMMPRYNIVPLGDSKYGFADCAGNLSQDVIDQILDYINKYEIVSTKDICIDLNNILPEELTPEILYFALKAKYEETYNFGGNSLVVSISSIEPSKPACIYDKLKRSNKPISNVKIMDEYKLNKSALSVIVSQNSDITFLDSTDIWLYSKMCNLSKIVSATRDYIKNKKSFFATDLFKYMKLKYNTELNECFISTFERYMRMMKKQIPDLDTDFEYDRFKKYYLKIDKTSKSTIADYEVEF